MEYRLGIAPATLTALGGAAFWPVVLVDIDWPGDPVQVHSGTGTLSWSDISWAGVNRAGGVSLPGDGPGVQMGRGSLTLGGSAATLASLLDSAPDAQGRSVQVHFGVVTERAGTTLVGEPFTAWRGFMAEAEESEEWNGSIARFQITVALESGAPPRAAATTLHNEAERLRSDPDEVFPDTSGRHFRGISVRTQNAVRR